MHGLKILKVLWAAPCSALGLMFAAVLLALGGSAALNHGAIEVTYRRSRAGCGSLALALPFRGIVFGHIILAVTAEELAIIAAHERVHVAQYEHWGPLFFVAYGLSSVWQGINGRNPYRCNYFEVQARERSAAASALRQIQE